MIHDLKELRQVTANLLGNPWELTLVLTRDADSGDGELTIHVWRKLEGYSSTFSFDANRADEFTFKGLSDYIAGQTLVDWVTRHDTPSRE